MARLPTSPAIFVNYVQSIYHNYALHHSRTEPAYELNSQSCTNRAQTKVPLNWACCISVLAPTHVAMSRWVMCTSTFPQDELLLCISKYTESKSLFRPNIYIYTLITHNVFFYFYLFACFLNSQILGCWPWVSHWIKQLFLGRVFGSDSCLGKSVSQIKHFSLFFFLDYEKTANIKWAWLIIHGICGQLNTKF